MQRDKLMHQYGKSDFVKEKLLQEEGEFAFWETFHRLPSVPELEEFLTSFYVVNDLEKSNKKQEKAVA